MKNKKIFGIGAVVLMILVAIAPVINGMQLDTEKTNDNKNDCNKDELINNFTITEQPARPPSADGMKSQEPVCSKGPNVYEPPWSSYWWNQEKEIYGVCDAWQEGTMINSDYGKTRIQTWAGGAGYTIMRLWLCQGFNFYPPKTTTYTIQITHSTEGFISGSTSGYHAGSACNSIVYFFYVAGFDNVERLTIRDEWSYFGGPGYSENFDETITHTFEVELEKGEKYWIGSQTLMKGWSEGFGLSYSSTDSKTKGDHSRLKSITINYDNDPPTKPTINGPASGSADTSYLYKFTSTDPDGDAVSFYIDWGDGITTDWTKLVTSGKPHQLSHKWPTSGTYTIRAKAKDRDDIESDWSTKSVTMPRNRAVHIPHHWFQNQHPILYQLLQQFH